MRRKERQITELSEILAVLDRCDSCVLALGGAEYPYAVPLSFGFTANGEAVTLYFHCAREGRKLELIQKDSRAGFCAVGSRRFVPGETACAATMKYESVCGDGILELVPEEEKEAGLQAVMRHYDGAAAHIFSEAALSATAVLKLTVREITGKAQG